VTQNPDEASHMMNGLDFPGATHQDIHGAVSHLAAIGGPALKTACMGFCMGGALTIAAAVHVPGLNAAVCYYGIPPADFADPARIAIPFQGHFADQDDWCTPAAVDGLEAALKAAGQTPEIHRYAAAHGFFNERRPDVYNAAIANLSWERTVAFLGLHLG
jgi:carboxymethylenebutenolidase